MARLTGSREEIRRGLASIIREHEPGTGSSNNDQEHFAIVVFGPFVLTKMESYICLTVRDDQSVSEQS